MTVQDQLDAIRSSPTGPSVAAFFDYDGTLIEGFSAKVFFRHRLLRLDVGLDELGHLIDAALNGVETPEAFEALLKATARGLAGRTVEELDGLGRKLFKEEICTRLHDETWRLLEAHKAMGHTIVIASSATRFQVEPAARSLGVEHVICTELEAREDGTFTGRIAGAIPWAEGKADAVLVLAKELDIDLDTSFAYSNGDEDVAFLETVGNPCTVEPEQLLEEVAAARGWASVACDPIPTSNPVADLVRTAGFYGAFGAAFGTSLGLGLVNGSRDQILSLTGGVGSDLGLALAGVEVDVVSGAEHLWAHRPAVFIFNHQSNIDPVVVMKLIRHTYTGVAKAEAKKIPGFGQLFQIAGVAFIERGNTEQARQALAPAVRKIRDQGLSLAISPEGTRTLTPTVGPFKKGAFHIAIQAEVPVVPIVLKGAGRVMRSGSPTLKPGRIEVVVLPPVYPDSWDPKDLNKPVDEVRQMYVETLANWPTKQTARSEHHGR